tara:strand:- start:1791 stop:2402 length:612 start_codon:yes stop_codon:yes gene_type:complete
MKNTTYIYELSELESNLPRYIGKSDNPDRRYREHLKDKKNSYKRNWITSLLKRGEVPVLTIIEEVSIDEWSDSEKYWIEQYKAWGYKLTNTGEGGEGFTGDDNTKHKLRTLNKAARDRGCYENVNLDIARENSIESRRKKLRKVEMFKDGNQVALFNSLPDASIVLGYNVDRIRDVIRGTKNKGNGRITKVHSYKGYTFKYEA